MIVRLVHNFQGENGKDGAAPDAGVTDVNGRLYGTAEVSKTVAKTALSGTESVLYRFHDEPDVGGKLYGTPSVGGFGPNTGYCTVCGTVDGGIVTKTVPLRSRSLLAYAKMQSALTRRLWRCPIT